MTTIEYSKLIFQVVVVGDGGVGKSSLIRRYCRGVFTSQYKKTIGVDFLERVVTLGEGRQVHTSKVMAFQYSSSFLCQPLCLL